MNWLLEHLQLVIAGAAALAYWLNQRTQAKSAEDEALPDEAAEELHADREETTALVPEDLHRRILEQLGIPQPEAEPPPVPPSLPAFSPPPPLPVEVAEKRSPVQPVALDADQPVETRINFPPPKSNSPTRRHALRDALQSTGKIREAMLLREILGPPVGLKPRDISRAH